MTPASPPETVQNGSPRLAKKAPVNPPAKPNVMIMEIEPSVVGLR